jgi:hypothetical protein
LWNQLFADVLRSIGLTAWKTENDISMGENQGLYEYIVVYVDDIMIAAKSRAEIIQVLQTEHKLKIKGLGSLKYHLGCGYFCDGDGTLCFGPQKYID